MTRHHDATGSWMCRLNLAALVLAAVVLGLVAPMALLALTPVLVLAGLLFLGCYPGEDAMVRAATRGRRAASRPAPLLVLTPRCPRDRRPRVGGPLGRAFAVRPPPGILATSR